MAVHFRCGNCGLVLLQAAERCPGCGASELLEVRGPRPPRPPRTPSRDSEADSEVDSEPGHSRPTDWEIAYHCPDEFVALTLQSELELHGIPSWIRSLELPGYQGLIRNQPTWGWLLVDRDDLEESGRILRAFLEAVEKGDL